MLRNDRTGYNENRFQQRTKKSLCSVATTSYYRLARTSSWWTQWSGCFSVKCITKYIKDVGPIQVKADFTRERKSNDGPQLASWCETTNKTNIRIISSGLFHWYLEHSTKTCICKTHQYRKWRTADSSPEVGPTLPTWCTWQDMWLPEYDDKVTTSGTNSSHCETSMISYLANAFKHPNSKEIICP